MAYTEFIAAIDLGSSHMVGMVGTKNPTGTLSIIAYEVENSTTSIRRGCVYNPEETANNVKRLVHKLENKLDGAKIAKVYVGIGGQSLRSIEHTVSRVLGTEGVVTDDILCELEEECRTFKPELLDVLATSAPSYQLDGKVESNPVSIPCSRIDACYKLIVGRPSLRRNVKSSITDRAKMEIADIIVSPLAVADVILTEKEKELGCALIGFGAGVTTLTVYKGGVLANLSVIPFGGNLITKDITSLNLVESEAERIKRTYGSAVMEKDDTQMIHVDSADGREIKRSQLNMIIEARMKEILENVYARLDATGLLPSLGAGIIITGGGAALRNLKEIIGERLKLNVRYSAVRKGIVEGAGEMIANNPEYAVAIGIMAKGTENCALQIAPKPAPKPIVKPQAEEEEEDVIGIKNSGTQEVKKKPEEPKKPKGPSWMDKLKDKANRWGGDLFNEEDI